MRLITRCPACATMFRVVPDQLRISDGWVRCGRCSEVFDAREHLQPVDAHGNLPVPQPQPPLQTIDVEVVPHAPSPPERSAAAAGFAALAAATDGPASEGSSAGAGVGLQSPLPQPSDAEETGPQPLRPSTAPAVAELPAMANIGRDILELAASIKADQRSLVTAHAEAAPGPELPEADKPVARPAGSRPVDPDDAELEQSLLFVREARRKAFWNGKLVRAGLALLALGLSGSLAAQFVHQYRDQLAAADARLKPWLERMCEPFHCSVGVPRQIESVIIEGSTFTKTRNRTYRLGFTLRNTASQPVATPALEVTLTDSQDLPLVRRVLRPGEFGAAVALAPGTDWSGAIAFGDDLKTDGRVAGYRLLAFYP